MVQEVPFRASLWVVWVYDDEDDVPYVGGSYETREGALDIARTVTESGFTVACITQMWAMQAVGGPIVGSIGWISRQIARILARFRGETPESALTAEEIFRMDQLREKLKEQKG